MPKYRVPVVFQMYGHVIVEADSKEEAEEAAHAPSIGLPEDASYIEGSFEVDDIFLDNDDNEYIIEDGFAVGDEVDVMDPVEGTDDAWSFGFTGIIERLWTNVDGLAETPMAVVRDQDDNRFDVETSKLFRH